MTRRVRLGASLEDEGVSPVVGMILVLAISIVGIAAILYWGLPAIDEMKANVEHRSVESQFLELDSSIKELVAGTTEKTAKRWQPTLHRGQVGIANETEGWVYAVEPYNPRIPQGWPTERHSFLYAGFGDGDSSFAIHSKNTSPTITIQAHRVDGTSSFQELTVDDPETAGVAATGSFALNKDVTKTLKLYMGTGATASELPIRNATIRFRIYEGSDKIGEAWYVPTGRVDYRLDAGLGTKTLMENNGAVISGNGQGNAIVNQPPIPPVANHSGVSRFFARAVVLNGSGGFAGDDRFDVLLTLYSTATLGNYDCSKADRTDCVESVKLFLFGSQAETWYSYLTNEARGYTLRTQPSILDPDTLGTQYIFTWIEDREGYMGFTLLQSTVLLSSG